MLLLESQLQPGPSSPTSQAMSNPRRPLHLQLRPGCGSAAAPRTAPAASPKPLSPSSETLPSQLLPHLYLGGQQHTGRDTLARLNIGYILSLGAPALVWPAPAAQAPQPQPQPAPGAKQATREFRLRLRPEPPAAAARPATPPSLDENQQQRARYLHCKCIDIADTCADQSLGGWLDEALQFIEEGRRKRCNVLVHCLAGVSRSAAVAIAYLMRLKSLRLQDAYALVKQCRPQIDPNLGFMGQLLVFERRLRDSGPPAGALASPAPDPGLPGPHSSMFC